MLREKLCSLGIVILMALYAQFYPELGRHYPLLYWVALFAIAAAIIGLAYLAKPRQRPPRAPRRLIMP